MSFNALDSILDLVIKLGMEKVVSDPINQNKISTVGIFALLKTSQLPSIAFYIKIVVRSRLFKGNDKQGRPLREQALFKDRLQ